jgi:hypothetical protein
MDATFFDALLSPIEPAVVEAEEAEEQQQQAEEQQRQQTTGATTPQQPAPSSSTRQATRVQQATASPPVEAPRSETTPTEQPSAPDLGSTHAAVQQTVEAKTTPAVAPLAAIPREAPMEARTLPQATVTPFNLASWMQTHAALSESQVQSLSPEVLRQVLGAQTEKVQALQSSVQQNDQLLEQQRQKKQQLDAVLQAHQLQQQMLQRAAPMHPMMPFGPVYPMPFNQPMQNLPMFFQPPTMQQPHLSMPMMNQPWQQQRPMQGAMPGMPFSTAPTMMPGAMSPFTTVPPAFMAQPNLATRSIPIPMPATFPPMQQQPRSSNDQTTVETLLQRPQTSEVKQPENQPSTEEKKPDAKQADAEKVERKENFAAEQQPTEKMQTEPTTSAANAPVVPPIDVSNVMAAAAAAAAASVDSSPNRTPAHEPQQSQSTPMDVEGDPAMQVEDPAMLREYIRRVQEANHQLSLQYQLARNTIMTVHQYVHQETSTAMREPPAAIFEMQSVLDEALARDIQLQQGTPSLDADPGTTLPRIPRRPSTSASAAQQASDPAASLAKMMSSDEERERRVRGKPRGKAAMASAPKQPKHKRQETTGAAAAAEEADTASALFSLASAGTSAAMQSSLRARVAAAQQSPLEHIYSTRKTNKPPRAVVKHESAEGAPKEAGKAGEEKGEDDTESEGREEETPLADAEDEEDEYNADESPFDDDSSIPEEDEFDDDDGIGDEEFRTGRKKARKKTKGDKTSGDYVPSPASRPKRVAAPGHHAMTTITDDISRYPLVTLFVHVQRQWTESKDVAKKMTPAERTELVLVPIRFMVAKPEHRVNATEGGGLRISDLYVVAKDISVLIHKRKCSVAKCWGRGTQLIMSAGSLKSVESIESGDLLLGDDGEPREVQPGSLVHGNTKTDAEGDHPAAAMYRIRSHDPTRTDFTCNGSHILVLRLRKVASCLRCSAEGRWAFEVYEQHTDGMIERETLTFFGHMEAVVALDSHPEVLEWESTVEQFLMQSQTVQQQAYMFSPGRLNYPSTKYLSLSEYLRRICKHPSWSDCELEVARMLGFRFAENFRSSGEAKGKLIEEFVGMLETKYQKEHGDVQTIYTHYQLDRRGALPISLLTESVQVRLHLMAGILDSAGTCTLVGSHITSEDPIFIDSVNHLARGLGLNHSVSNDEHFIGGELMKDVPTVLTRKLINVPSTQTPLGFSVERIDHAEYFGFSVDGNGRVLLSDFTVSHNSIYNFTGQCGAGELGDRSMQRRLLTLSYTVLLSVRHRKGSHASCQSSA